MKKLIVTTMVLCAAIAAQADWSGSLGVTTATEGTLYYVSEGVNTYFDTFTLDSDGNFSYSDIGAYSAKAMAMDEGTYSFLRRLLMAIGPGLPTSFR